MKVVSVYCCPIPFHGPQHIEFAYRFVASWLNFPPDYSHSLMVVSNGGKPTSEMQILFSSIDEFSGFIENDDLGWDIGAFQKAALTVPCDLMVFFGGNAYFTRENWLRRMVHVTNEHGLEHLYGAFASMVHKPHIRTTGFWCQPSLLNSYPKRITNHEERYDFEHRTNCLTEWVQSLGRKTLYVTWSGVYSPIHWGQVRNGYHNGNQNECLLRDRVSDMFCLP